MAVRFLALLIGLMIPVCAVATAMYPNSNFLFGGSESDGASGQLLQLTLFDGTIYTASTSHSPIGPENYAENFGWWSNKLGHFAGNYNYLSGYVGVFDSINHNFFSFDLSNLNRTVRTATLRLRAYSASFQFAPMRFDLYDVSTPTLELFQDAAFNPIQQIFDDLGSGTHYGTLSILDAPDYFGELSVQLNDAAVADINNRQARYFSIGGTTNLIPEPGGMALVILGISCLIVLRPNQTIANNHRFVSGEPPRH